MGELDIILNTIDLELFLNECLNEALCGDKRITGIPDSNKIANFVSDYLKDNEHYVKPCPICGNSSCGNGICFYPFDIDGNPI